MTPLLEVQDLVMHFGSAKRVVKAVNGISFVIAPGEALALVGESGSGKTTVGRSLLRLIEPTGGRVAFLGQDITAMPVSRFRPLRSRLQMVFQEPFASLNPRMRVGRIVEEPLLLSGERDASRRRERCLEALALVGLPPSAGMDSPTSSAPVNNSGSGSRAPSRRDRTWLFSTNPPRRSTCRSGRKFWPFSTTCGAS